MRAPLVLLLLPAVAAAEVPVAPMDDGDAVEEVLAVQRFTLEEGAWRYDWLAGAPAVRAGFVVSLRADPAFLVARQVQHPVLYVGPVPLHVVGSDAATGCVAGVLPAAVAPAEEPWFFGSWELPERVDAERGAAEREAALRAGLRARPPAEVTRWSRTTVRAPSPADLRRAAHTSLASCIHETDSTRPDVR